MTTELDIYSRYQSRLQISDVFPSRKDKRCACGCEKVLTGRQTRWASEQCMNQAVEFFLIIKGDRRAIRQALYKRDKGICQACGNQSTDLWHADHIVPVHRGGGGCDLDNFQTLCPACHKRKTTFEKTSFSK